MKEIKCTIIQDILPLYIDGVVSQDTREMVEEHLKHCEKCQHEHQQMKHEIYIPEENKASLFKTINKKWRKKKIIISCISAFITTLILLGVFEYVFHYETIIPYSEDIVKIENNEDKILFAHYYGKSYASVNVTHPMLLEVDGEKKNISFIYYNKTIADSPTRQLINNGKARKEQDFIFEFPEAEEIDAVYYAEYDVKKIAANKDSWNNILKDAVLIWKKME